MQLSSAQTAADPPTVSLSHYLPPLLIAYHPTAFQAASHLLPPHPFWFPFLSYFPHLPRTTGSPTHPPSYPHPFLAYSQRSTHLLTSSYPFTSSLYTLSATSLFLSFFFSLSGSKQAQLTTPPFSHPPLTPSPLYLQSFRVRAGASEYSLTLSFSHSFLSPPSLLQGQSRPSRPLLHSLSAPLLTLLGSDPHSFILSFPTILTHLSPFQGQSRHSWPLRKSWWWCTGCIRSSCPSCSGDKWVGA